ncbi:RNA polymerase II C-terminal domain phosphatase-like 4 [Castanea sativa]|uniref:RNA polymerase II C-terminal domain phosphatase-like 4 n=1 Tax=Castanea sativa TaxID=21020 RepID=UPI003F6515FC
MKIISERGFPQDDYGDYDDTLEENTEETCEHLCVYRGKCVSCERLAFKNVHQDQSLIHSTEQEKYLRTPQELLQHNLRDSLFRLSPPWEKMMLKLRPSVHTFLKEASAMFEIYLCTTGTRSYALKVTEFLDPENVYFKYSRIIAREDLFETDEKSLDIVLREQRMVLALDDTKSVRRKNEVNLILVKKYHYFDSDDDLSHVSLSALETDEDETTGTLPAVLEELFFNPKFEAGLSHRNVGFIFTRRSVL